MHVSVDATRESEIISPVENLLGLLHRHIGRESIDFPVPDRDVETID
jgi:hypothetical protein